METTWQNEGPQNESGEPNGNVIPFAPRQAAAIPAPAPEPFLTDAERREIREMLAYYRVARPQFEAIKSACPTARFLLEGDE